MESMGALQAWLVIGIPALVLTTGLFLKRTPVFGTLAFLVLAAGFGAMAMADRASAAVLGALLALLYAAGRGGSRERPADGQPDWRRVEAGSGHR